MQYFSLNTNVKQLRIGRGVSKGIGKELGKYVVATMEIPWNIIKNEMGKSPEKVIDVTSVEKQWIEDQITNLPEFDTIVGIGGGMAIDVAKYISWKLNKNLVSIPTILRYVKVININNNIVIKSLRNTLIMFDTAIALKIRQFLHLKSYLD